MPNILSLHRCIGRSIISEISIGIHFSKTKNKKKKQEYALFSQSTKNRSSEEDKKLFDNTSCSSATDGGILKTNTAMFTPG